MSGEGGRVKGGDGVGAEGCGAGRWLRIRAGRGRPRAGRRVRLRAGRGVRVRAGRGG